MRNLCNIERDLVHLKKTGCDIGYYGVNCTKCPDNCLDEICQLQIGHCFDCKHGFKGDMCEEGKMLHIYKLIFQSLANI